MAEGKIRVKFEPKGDKQLIDAIKALRRETKKLAGANTVLTTETKKANREQGKQEQRTRNLSGTFSVLRSKMLLTAFAVTQFVRPFGALGQRSVMIAANFEALETRLTSMTGSVGLASQMMAEFRDIAATTPFAVQDVVEAGVQLRAFGVNAQEMIKPVTDLAAFMGTTATEAASALGRAFAGGAGAADILRERGILQLIKDSQGIEDLSKTTLPEFREALESALVDPTAGIVGATDKLSKTAVGSFSNMRDSWENFLARFAETSGLKRAAEAQAGIFTRLFNKFSKSMTPEDEGLTALEKIRKKQQEILDIQKAFEGTGELWYVNRSASRNVERLRKEIEQLEPLLTGFTPTEETPSIFDRFEPPERAMSYMDFLDMLSGGVAHATQKIREFNSELQIHKVSISEVSEITPKYTDFQRQLSASLGLLPEEIQDITTNAQQSARAVNAVSQAMIAMAGDNKDRIVQGLKLAKLAAVADSIAGASKSFAQGGVAGFTGGIAMLASMMQRIATIDQQIAQAQAEKFALGGLVGGRRHSQGGTIIEAERGEFVMSRNAVSAIGVENLNRMNQGQSSGGSINISINGGMISPDFVENELAESIREAVRRGADFGIS